MYFIVFLIVLGIKPKYLIIFACYLFANTVYSMANAFHVWFSPHDDSSNSRSNEPSLSVLLLKPTQM